MGDIMIKRIAVVGSRTVIIMGSKLLKKGLECDTIKAENMKREVIICIVKPYISEKTIRL